MTKAILVIDTPNRCDECIFCDTKDIVMSDDTYGCCAATRRMIKANVLCTGFFEIKKPKWCPLKPMPYKKSLSQEVPSITFIDGKSVDSYTLGWNDCIECILGEEE